MDEKLLEIRAFTDPGYRPVFDYGAWRVAILNYLDEIHPGNIHFMERHHETDEVFVLLKGQGILFIGEGESSIESISVQVLEPNKIYNVKKNTWHSVVLSRDGSVLIVENQDTDWGNSSRLTLSRQQQAMILETARREQPDWS